ncbi:hypothetical protein V6M85_08115 [Sulfolobus tengchongensis]|uniref:Transposase n=2 Tax=Sulfolobus tengchongensis TaxID=207809 RepID=A0AAX4KX40_9CREN
MKNLERVIIAAIRSIRARIRRRFQGEFTKKRNRSYFGYKVFVIMCTSLLVHDVEVKLANLPDNSISFNYPDYKVVDRGFRGLSSSWKVLSGFWFRRHVEFFWCFS